MPVRVSAPVEEKLDVAVAPKYAGPYEEKSVVDAPAEKICRALHVFAAERETLPVPRHVPLTSTHPPESKSPFAKVEVADPVTFSATL